MRDNSIAIFYLVGLFSLWGGLRTLFIASAGTYALASYLPTSPYMPWMAFVFLMGHMAINQLERQFQGNPEVMDITGTQMVLVMKLSAFAWNVFDGTLPDSELSELQQARKVEKLPGILDYAAYVLFFPSLMAGPAFDYNEYRNWIDTTMFNVPPTVDPSKKPPTRFKRKIPRSGTPAMWTMASGLGYILLFLKFGGWFYPEWMLEDGFVQSGILRRIFYLHMVGLTVRFKYYGAWFLAEGSCILAGLGYNGVDPKTGKVSWDRLQNVSPWGVETGTNSRAYLENWNMNTNKWLRNYIYLRVTPKGQKPGFRASMATFVTSAFWHGFYPGYYLTFILASFVQTAAKSKSSLLWTTTWVFVLLTIIACRCPPPCATLLPRSEHAEPAAQQEVLRHCYLARYTARLLFRRRTFLPAHPGKVHHRLVARLLLRCHRHHCEHRLLLEPWESVPQEGSRGALAQGRSVSAQEVGQYRESDRASTRACAWPERSCPGR